MQVQKRTLNWFPKQSAWAEMEALRAKRQAMAQQFLSESSALSSSLGSAWSSQITNIGEIAARAAASRLNVTL